MAHDSGPELNRPAAVFRREGLLECGRPPQPVTPCGGRGRAPFRAVARGDSVRPADRLVGGRAPHTLARRGTVAHHQRTAVGDREALSPNRAAQARGPYRAGEFPGRSHTTVGQRACLRRSPSRPRRLHHGRRLSRSRPRDLRCHHRLPLRCRVRIRGPSWRVSANLRVRRRLRFRPRLGR